MFRNRRKFSILTWLSNNVINTYPAFIEFLASKNVIPPDEAYYNRALNEHNNISTVTSQEELSKANEQEASEDVKVEPANNDKSDVVEEAVAVDVKPKRRRRRKKEV